MINIRLFMFFTLSIQIRNHNYQNPPSTPTPLPRVVPFSRFAQGSAKFLINTNRVVSLLGPVHGGEDFIRHLLPRLIVRINITLATRRYNGR